MGRPRDTAQLHEALETFFALPRDAQLELHRVAGNYLSALGRTETDIERGLRRQAETLAALQAVQEELDLTADRAPTADQFDDVAKRLGLDEDRNSVRRAHGAYSAATTTLTGGAPVESAAQRSHRREIARRTPTRVEHIAGIAQWLEWLKTLPGSPPERWSDYKSYADQHNATAAPGKLLIGESGITKAFPLLSWQELKAAARKQLDPWQLHRRRVRELAAQARTHELVSVGGIGALRGITTSSASELVDEPTFPSPVATLSSVRAWRTDEVLAHLGRAEEAAQPDEAGEAARNDAAGQSQEPAQQSDDDELRAETLYDCAQLTTLLRIADGVVIKYVCARAWHLVPRPSGDVGGVHYWKHSVVTSWLASPEGVAAMRRRAAQRGRA